MIITKYCFLPAETGSFKINNLKQRILNSKLIKFKLHLESIITDKNKMYNCDLSSDNAFSSKYLMVEDYVTKETRRISYYQVEGKRRPGIVFIPGFMAYKTQTKSIKFLHYCLENDIPYISYDTAGFGDSAHEIKRSEARFTHWLQDAREVLRKLTDGPQVVIGSSMGGWLSMILAQEKEMRDKFAGLVLLAPAYNFGEAALEDMEKTLPEEMKEKLRGGHVFEQVDPRFLEYGPTPISLELFQGMIPFNVPLEENKIDIDIPVRILHGTKDEIIPPSRSEALINAIKSEDVKLMTIKGCIHELSDPKGRKSIFMFTEELLKLLSNKDESS